MITEGVRYLRGTDKRCAHTGGPVTRATTDRARLRVAEGFCPHCPSRMTVEPCAGGEPGAAAITTSGTAGRCPCCQQRWSLGGTLLIFHGVTIDAETGVERNRMCCTDIGVSWIPPGYYPTKPDDEDPRCWLENCTCGGEEEHR